MQQEDNWSRQADEVEALSAIYGSDWSVEDAVDRRYSIGINDGSTDAENCIQLQVTFSEDYPSHAPPRYRVHAPWLRGADRLRLDEQMKQTTVENAGECVVFKFIDVVREFLESKSFSSVQQLDASSVPSALQFSGVEHRPSPTESDNDDGNDDEADDEYGFDPILHVWHPPENPVIIEARPNDIALPEIFHGEKFTDRKSVFQGHLAAVTHPKQVDMVMEKLKEDRKIVAATHRIIAYRIECGGGGVFSSGCDDDGEFHAGSRMLHLLNIMDARNVMVVVTRWYGGIHLGPDRFKHINNCTRNMLEAHGFIRDKSDKKGPKSCVTQQVKKKKR